MKISGKFLIRACLTLAVIATAVTIADAQESTSIDNPDSLWIQANNLYAEGKYEPALELYTAALNQKGHAPEVFYNIGNTYAMLGENGKAALMYERALELNPRYEDALHNLKLLAPSDNFPDVFVLFKPVWFIKERMTGRETAWLAGVLYIAGFVGLALVSLISARSRKNFVRMISIICLLLAGLFIVIIWQKLDAQAHRPEAIILNNSVARSGPSTRNQSVLELPEGLKVREKGRPDAGWVEIQLLTGQTAFVPAGDIERI
jgi:tetratricopeptide (TPR) repeat protein